MIRGEKLRVEIWVLHWRPLVEGWEDRLRVWGSHGLW